MSAVLELLRPVRRWLVVASTLAVCGATLGLTAGPALAASTPNESETVTCGGSVSTDCFDVSESPAASVQDANGDPTTSTYSATSDTITETFVISDPMFGGSDVDFDAKVDGQEIGTFGTSQINCVDANGNLFPGPSPVMMSGPQLPVTCTATFQPSGTDLDRGYIDTDFNVTSTTDAAPQPVTSGTYAIYRSGHVPAVSVGQTDSIDGPSSNNEYAAAGESIDYTATVTNTGEAASGSVSAVSVADSNPSIAYSCPAGSLAVGASENCTGSYTVTQNDMDIGPVDSMATATATPASSGVPVVSAPEDLSLNPDQLPAATLVQTPQVGSFTGASRPISYAENVTNSGNVTLFSPTIANTLNGLLPLQCNLSVIPPGTTAACTQTYLTSSGDVAVGAVANTATMTLGTPDATVSSNPSSSVVPYAPGAYVPATTYTAPASVTPPATTPPSETTTGTSGDTQLVVQPIAGLTRGAPSMRFAVSVAHGAPDVQQVTVTLPTGLRVLTHRVKGRTVVHGVSVAGARVRSVSVSHGHLVVLLRSATRDATISLSRSALGESSALRTEAQQRKLASLRLKVAARDTHHQTRTITVTVRHFTS